MDVLTESAGSAYVLLDIKVILDCYHHFMMPPIGQPSHTVLEANVSLPYRGFMGALNCKSV